MRPASRVSLLALVLLVAVGAQADINFKPAGGGVSSASPTFTGNTTVDHLSVAGADPTCTVAGAGTGATCVSTGCADSACRLSIITGTTATANVTVTVTFAASFAAEPVCIGQPKNVGGGGTWNAAVTVRGASTSDNTKCVWNVANTAAVSDGTEYEFDYVAIGL